MYMCVCVCVYIYIYIYASMREVFVFRNIKKHSTQFKI